MNYLNKLLQSASMVDTKQNSIILENGNIYDIFYIDMEIINVSKCDRINNSTSSKGYQRKWAKDNKYIKLDNTGYESIAEILSNWVCYHSNISIEDYVSYYPCLIYEDNILLGKGCYSYNFLKENEQEFSLLRLMQLLNIDINCDYDDLRYEIIKNVNLDIKPKLDVILSIDSIVRNEDRHLHNISIIKNNDSIKLSPIFDCGASCMSDLISYPMEVDFYDNYRNIYAKPFNTDFKKQLQYNERLYVNPDFIDNTFYSSNKFAIRGRDVIRQGLSDMYNIAWNY